VDESTTGERERQVANTVEASGFLVRRDSPLHAPEIALPRMIGDNARK
jgi:hypothetical protein